MAVVLQLQITSRYPRINALDFRIHNISNNQHYAYFWSTEVALFHQGNKKILNNWRNDVTGNTVAHGLVIDGKFRFKWRFRCRWSYKLR